MSSRRLSIALLPVVLAASLGCSDVSTKHVGISCIDRYAARGEDLRLEIGTRRSMSGTINAVSVSSPALGMNDQQVYVSPPEAPGIPNYLTSENKLLSTLYSWLIADSKHPTVEVRVPVPSGAGTAAGTNLAVAVSYSVAEWCGPGQFDVNSRTETLMVPVTTVEPGREWLAHLVDLGMPLLILAALTTAYALLARTLDRKGLLNSSIGSFGLFLVVAAWFWASLTWAVWPICANLGWVLPAARLSLAIALPACAMWAITNAVERLAHRWQARSSTAN